MALLAEKTQQIDPRMPDDVIDICRAEIERMSQGNEVPPAPIYKRANSTQQCIRNVKKCMSFYYGEILSFHLISFALL